MSIIITIIISVIIVRSSLPQRKELHRAERELAHEWARAIVLAAPQAN